MAYCARMFFCKYSDKIYMSVFRAALFIILLLILPLALQGSYDFGSTRDGGDLVSCKKSSNHRYDGLYSLDYIATRKSHTIENADAFVFPSDSDCMGHLELIKTRLEKISPRLGLSFEAFKRDFFQKSRGREFVSQAKDSLFDINDANLARALPANCSASQLGIREETMGYVRYQIDGESLRHLSKERPLQCSYFLIHEWARDFLVDSVEIRTLNEFLHSTRFMHTLNTETIRMMIPELDKSNLGIGQNNVFQCPLVGNDGMEQLSTLIRLYEKIRYKMLHQKTRH